MADPSPAPDSGVFRRIDYDAAAHAVHRLEVDGRERSWLVHMPSGLAPGEGPRPLWIVLHGGGTCAARMVEFSGLSELADRERFVACYPEGTGWLRQSLTFNAGACCGYAKTHEVDDVGFVDRLLDEMLARYDLDAGRVYAVGFSNGGMMAYRLGNRLSARIAAIASVAGQACVDLHPPRRPVPAVHFHGTADQFAPYEGGVGPRSMSKTDHRSVRETLTEWALANDCDPAPVEESTQSCGGNLSSRRTVWRGGGVDRVVLHTIEGGGHTWPGRSSRFPILGAVAMKVDAHAILAEFFARHTLADDARGAAR